MTDLKGPVTFDKEDFIEPNVMVELEMLLDKLMSQNYIMSYGQSQEDVNEVAMPQNFKEKQKLR